MRPNQANEKKNNANSQSQWWQLKIFRFYTKYKCADHLYAVIIVKLLKNHWVHSLYEIAWKFMDLILCQTIANTSTTHRDSIDDFASNWFHWPHTLSFAVESNACHFSHEYIQRSNDHKTQAIIFACAYKMISMSKVDGARPISMWISEEVTKPIFFG